MNEIRFMRLRPSTGGDAAPSRATPHAAGIDLPSHCMVMLPPGGRAIVGTGFAVEIPDGYEGQIRPRSGLASNHGVTVLNSPGTIDSDYRGELKVLLINHGSDTYTVNAGERIAQLVVAPIALLPIVEIDELNGTARGSAGFGSTG